MNEILTKFIKNTKGFMRKHSPEILTGIGVTGMITTTVLAVKATPKALILLENAKNEKNGDLTVVETVKVAWKPYIPAVLTGVASVTCIIGASTVSTKRNAALAAAYTLSEKTLLTYRDKVVETIGEKKEKEVREKIAQDEVDKHPISTSQVIITSKGTTLCKDSLSKRYFESDIDTIKRIINNLNRNINNRDYVSLNEFYHELGLEGVTNGDRLGWNVSDGLIDVDFDACITEDDRPCIVVEHLVPPKYDFDKFG
jgi:hypothetical protein